MDAILQLPPTLPPHDAAPLAPVPYHVVAEWPAETFLENLAILPSGVIAVTVLSEARLDRVTPDGAVTVWHQFDAPATGVALTAGGRLFVAVGEPGAGDATLWCFDPETGAGEAWMTLGGVGFANGLTPFAPDTLLVAESWRGQLCLIDLSAKRVDVWIEHEQLSRAPGLDFLPGANGVKRFRDEVSVSSTGRALMLRTDVRPDGSTGTLTPRNG